MTRIFPLLPLLLIASISAAAIPSATAPSAAADPKSALSAFMHALLAGDEPAALSHLYLPDADSRTLSLSMLDMGQEKWNRALAQVFTGENLPLPDGALPPDMDHAIAAAKLTVIGDSAHIDLDLVTMWLVRDNGTWKVDFARNLRDPKTAPPKSRVAEIAVRDGVFNQTIADMKLGKFKTSAQANAELATRMAAATAPKVDPKFALAISTISNLKAALDAFEVDNGNFPTTPQGLDALVHQPAGMNNWTHPYIEAVPNDPWGHPFVYASPGKNDPDYDLTSEGPDGILGTDDDLTQDTHMPR